MRKTTLLWAMMFCFVGTLFAQTPAEMAEIQAAKAVQGQSTNVQDLVNRFENIGTTAMPLTNYFTSEEIALIKAYKRSSSVNRLADIIPTAGATETFVANVGDFIYDPSDGINGGPGGDCSTTSSGDPGDYPNCDCITVTTLDAPPGEQISVTFNSFRVFGNFDWFAIFDGSGPVTATNGSGSAANPTSGDPELWNSSVDGDELVDMINAGMTTFTSTNGSLTFASRFSGVVNTCGWEAEVVPAGGGGGGGTPIAYGFEAFNLNMYGSFDPVAPEVFTSLSLGANDGDFELAGDVDTSNAGTAYVATLNTTTLISTLYSVDIATGAYTLVGPMTEGYVGFSSNPVDGVLYGFDTNLDLYTIDTATGASTLIAPITGTGSAGLADIAITGAGIMYVHDLGTDEIYTIDLVTGVATLVGATGFDANFAQGMTWDPNSDTLFLAAYNPGAARAEWRSVNITTGATTVVGNINDPANSEVTWVSVPDTDAVIITNDDCVDAIAMDCGAIETGDTANYTNTGGANASPDAWYSYTGSGFLEIITLSLCDGATSYDSILTVYDSCGGAVVIDNDDSCGLQSEVTFTSDGTTTYYIAVEGFGTGSGAYSLALTCVVPLDDCETAGSISCGETVLGSTANGASSDPGAPDCGAGNASPGLWYQINDTSGLVTDYTVSLCDGGTTYDSKLVIYSGDCGTLVCVAENDDSCGLQSEVSFQGDGSSTYYILVNGFGTTSNGDFSLNLSCTPVPPPNDRIANSIDVDEIGFPYTDPAVAMPAATTEAGSPADCDNAGVLGVWYNFVAEIGGTATATVTSPAGYTSVTFYTAPTEAATETELTLVPWFDNQCVPGVTTSIPVVAGQAYYVYVANHEGITDIVIDGDFFLGVGDAVVDGFTYFPNPANNELNLDAGTRRIDSATIYNILGQTVVDQKVGASNTRLNVANLSVGTYIMKVIVEGEVGTYKIVKQ
ncbi:T9SS type A sorting domain-containing protein [Rasiella sp. SM2506]|uniref:T9SS type A sorting domain-containing protein n=1 Tax=Rasiella sp. SM2506 TaxID=3423914 RepID=UPI003D7BB4EC